MNKKDECRERLDKIREAVKKDPYKQISLPDAWMIYIEERIEIRLDPLVNIIEEIVHIVENQDLTDNVKLREIKNALKNF